MLKKGLHELSKEMMGIAHLLGIVVLPLMILLRKIKLMLENFLTFVRKGNLRDRMDFVAL